MSGRLITHSSDPGRCACEDSDQHMEDENNVCERRATTERVDSDGDRWRVCQPCKDDKHMPETFD